MKYGVAIKSSAMAILSLGFLCANVYADDSQTMPTATDKTQEQTPAVTNKLMGEKFLAKNKLKKGVVTLPDGLQYKVITSGKGPKPADTDTVTVNYAGKLIDGTEFDSSYKRGEPASFPVSGVIQGWTEALKLMKVGSTWELYIPSSLAYGEQGTAPTIGPNETLIFKVNLISINKP